MAKSFSYNGTDLSTLGLQVTEDDIPEMPAIATHAHSAIFGDSNFTSVNHTTRSVDLECSVCADSQDQLQSRMDSIKGLLNSVLGDKVLTIDRIKNRRFIGRLVGMSAPETKGRWIFTFSLSFICTANTQSLDETNASIAIATDPDTLVVSAPAGNVSRIPTEFYVRNETGVTITSGTVIISNDTTNEAITVKATIQDDFWLKIGSLDSQGRFIASIQISTTNGADPEALIYTSAEQFYESGDWPRLKGGVDNDITITGISTGTLETTYRDLFL